MAKFEGSIIGKDIITYNPKGGKRYSPDDIGQSLKKFKLCNALRLIGQLSYKIHTHYEGLQIIKNIPVYDAVLAYLSMRLIESSNDYRSENMTIEPIWDLTRC